MAATDYTPYTQFRLLGWHEYSSEPKLVVPIDFVVLWCSITRRLHSQTILMMKTKCSIKEIKQINQFCKIYKVKRKRNKTETSYKETSCVK